MQTEDKHLADKFISGLLTGIERENFLQRIQNDVQLKQYVAFRKSLIDGIKSSYYNDLISEVQSHIQPKRKQMPFALRLTLAFLALTFAGVIFVYITDDDHKIGKITLPFFHQKEQIKKDETVTAASQEKNEKESENVETSVDADSSAVASSDSTINTTNIDSLMQLTDGDTEFRKDQMLIAADIPLTNYDEVDETMSDRATAQLNPAAGLPENSKSNFINVEFWVNVLNYQGYKFDNHKLIVYGIEQPDLLALYEVDNKLYANIKEQYYQLSQGDRLNKFLRLKEEEVPQVILKK